MTTKTAPTPISNAALGERLGVTKSMASRIRNGKRLPSAVTLARIADEFKIPVARLVAARNEGPAAFKTLLATKIGPSA